MSANKICISCYKYKTDVQCLQTNDVLVVMYIQSSTTNTNKQVQYIQLLSIDNVSVNIYYTI